MDVSLRLSSVTDRVRELLWFWPAVGVVVGLVTGNVLAAHAGDPVVAEQLLVAGSPSDIRSLMVGILAALITALSVAFSLTLVAIQTAGTNYGPRLLRNYLRDPGTQVVLVLLLGTSAYCLGVILGAPQDTVPRLAATGGVLLALLSVGAIAYFLGHIAESLRVESVLARVTRECTVTIDRVTATRAPATPGDAPVLLPAERIQGWTTLSARSRPRPWRRRPRANPGTRPGCWWVPPAACATPTPCGWRRRSRAPGWC